MKTVARGNSAKRVLVVEDDRDLSVLFRDILASWGCEVRLAAHGVDALEAARAFLPDVVICHVGLQRLDGYAVVRGLRADPALHGVHAVALTALPEYGAQRQVRDAGFDLCLDITKPSTLLALRRALWGSEACAGTCRSN